MSKQNPTAPFLTGAWSFWGGWGGGGCTATLPLLCSPQGSSKQKVLVMEYCSSGSLLSILEDPANAFGLAEPEFLVVLQCVGEQRLSLSHWECEVVIGHWGQPACLEMAPLGGWGAWLWGRPEGFPFPTALGMGCAL